jgi:hypothetical protein
MKKFIITSASVASGDKRVVLKLREVVNAIVNGQITQQMGTEYQLDRATALMLIDMHNSGRAGSIPSNFFKNGNDVNSAFRMEVAKLIGKDVVGPIEVYEEGSEYVAEDYSSAVKSGEAQIGDILTRKSAGARVENGFLTIPMSAQEFAQETLLANNPVLAFQALFGITMNAPVLDTPAPTESAFQVPSSEIETEVFGAAVNAPTTELDSEEANKVAKPAKI